jgi:hypothetical protein
MYHSCASNHAIDEIDFTATTTFGKQPIVFGANRGNGHDRWAGIWLRPWTFVLVIAAAIVLGLPCVSLAADVSWINSGTADWLDAQNWDPHLPVGVSDTAYIDNGGTAQLNSTIANADSPGTVRIGTVGTGTVEHFAGEWLRGASLQIGLEAGSSGMYKIGGTANASFGTVNIASTVSSGVLEQTGGQLDCYQYYVYSGGRQIQSAGTSNVRDRLYSRGEYELSGTGILTCNQVELHGLFTHMGGSHEVIKMGVESGTYLMQGGTYQAEHTGIGVAHNNRDSPRCRISGGTMNMGNLAVRTTGMLTVSGGTLAISDSIDPGSPMAFTAGNWSIDVRGGIGDFTNATFADIQQASLISQPGTLTLLPAGVNPAQFASYSPGGLVHVGGSPLTVPAGQSISGQGAISDRLIVHGSLIRASHYNYSDPYIRATGGVEVHAGGEFNLGGGRLTVNDPTSGMTGGSLKAGEFYVGNGAAGRFVQTGGAFDDGDTPSSRPEIYVGYGSGGDGYYELAGGTIRAYELNVGGGPGVGHFRQSDGLVRLKRNCCIGSGSRYEMQGGSLFSRELYCSGLVTQTGGTMTTDEVPMASRNESGVYDLQGGTHQVGTLWLGKYRDSHASYRVSSSGELVVKKIWVGAEYGSTSGADGQGSLEVVGGSVSCRELVVGRRLQGINELCISDQTASITISELLKFGPSAYLSTVPGATIHMTGETVANDSTNASAMDGLSQLQIVAEGGASNHTQYEVAGEDLGAIADGLLMNFSLGKLSIGGNQPGCVQLIDEFDNQQDGQFGNEALYLHELEVGPGSCLDLNGLNVYYQTFNIDASATIILNGGRLLAVPEPTTFVMLCLAAISLLAGTRRIGKRGA